MTERTSVPDPAEAVRRIERELDRPRWRSGGSIDAWDAHEALETALYGRLPGDPEREAS